MIVDGEGVTGTTPIWHRPDGMSDDAADILGGIAILKEVKAVHFGGRDADQDPVAVLWLNHAIGHQFEKLDEWLRGSTRVR